MDDDPLSDWGLRPVELADQPTLTPYFASITEPLSDYTFSQIYSWRNSLRILWTVLHGHLCVFANGSGDLTLLMPPIGQGNSMGNSMGNSRGNSNKALSDAFGLMDDYNAGHGVPGRSRVEYASEELLRQIDPTGLIVQPMGADYVYDINRMIDLAGGDLASKRQAKNRFQRNYEFSVEPYEATRHLEHCRKLLDGWKIHQDASHLDESNVSSIKRQKESIATDLTLQFAEQLGLAGLVVYAKPRGTDQPLALRGFTFGEYLGQTQSSITIEKTDLEIKGLAQFIFSEFCRLNWTARPLVNVGDDWGLESLAWTKMSYRPVKLLQKFTIRRAAVVRVAVPVEIKPSAVAERIPTTIRPAKRDDLAAAIDLEKNCFSSYSLNKRQLIYLQQRSSAVFLVAEQKGKVIGEGIALIRQHKRGLSGRIYSLAVNPEVRGQGIGLSLLQAMIDELSIRGVRRIYLEVEEHNAPAIGLYHRCDFRGIGILPDYYGVGKSALHFMREIPVEVGLFSGAAQKREPVVAGHV